MGQVDASAGAFARAIALAPDNARAYIELGENANRGEGCARGDCFIPQRAATRQRLWLEVATVWRECSKPPGPVRRHWRPITPFWTYGRTAISAIGKYGNASSPCKGINRRARPVRRRRGLGCRRCARRSPRRRDGHLPHAPKGQRALCWCRPDRAGCPQCGRGCAMR